VKQNANQVLATLNNPALTAEERTATFNTYMDVFADIDAISNFVIGIYSRRFTPDELARYRKAFRTYALAVYETELDAYRGEAVIVRNSVDRSPTDSIVNTYIRRQNRPDVDVRWRVLERNGQFQIVDVALNFDGNLIWLAIEQRAQFLALLDRTNGSADALIAEIERMTEELNRQRFGG
jgi:phospholipid transport system substrate-binding protein